MFDLFSKDLVLSADSSSVKRLGAFLETVNKAEKFVADLRNRGVIVTLKPPSNNEVYKIGCVDGALSINHLIGFDLFSVGALCYPALSITSDQIGNFENQQVQEQENVPYFLLSDFREKNDSTGKMLQILMFFMEICLLAKKVGDNNIYVLDGSFWGHFMALLEYLALPNKDRDFIDSLLKNINLSYDTVLQSFWKIFNDGQNIIAISKSDTAQDWISFYGGRVENIPDNTLLGYHLKQNEYTSPVFYDKTHAFVQRASMAFNELIKNKNRQKEHIDVLKKIFLGLSENGLTFVFFKPKKFLQKILKIEVSTNFLKNKSFTTLAFSIEQLIFLSAIKEIYPQFIADKIIKQVVSKGVDLYLCAIKNLLLSSDKSENALELFDVYRSE